eukprot:CAMPEP_0204279270 /NCGR_PEP_ID=MMETSP0468-20130131/34663_1 /ASSEMBLY_ACC=CAM_ASM_000383 /TAXON_ID=2969 /ORGANISM="Oxyrrhis marina" /LENGTH=137 /DNA_ID=CAMNT_0051256339 /DNA_START=8 /DNA_END=421 /DNA_ORIENTATION=+
MAECTLLHSPRPTEGKVDSSDGGSPGDFPSLASDPQTWLCGYFCTCATWACSAFFATIGAVIVAAVCALTGGVEVADALMYVANGFLWLAVVFTIVAGCLLLALAIVYVHVSWCGTHGGREVGLQGQQDGARPTPQP